MQIRLSVTTPQPARSASGPGPATSRPVADLAIDCAAGTAFSAVATALRNLAGLGPAEQFFAGDRMRVV